MDSEYLARLRYCEPNPRTGYYHIWNVGETRLTCRLPKTGYTNPNSSENVSFLIPEEEFEEPEALRESQPKELLQIEVRHESSEYSSGSNEDSPPENLYLGEDENPTPPGTPTTSEGLEWAQYASTRQAIFERKLSNAEKLAEWKHRVKAKERRQARKLSEKIYKARSKQEGQGGGRKVPNNLMRARRMNNINKLMGKGESANYCSTSS